MDTICGRDLEGRLTFIANRNGTPATRDTVRPVENNTSGGWESPRGGVRLSLDEKQEDFRAHTAPDSVGDRKRFAVSLAPDARVAVVRTEADYRELPKRDPKELDAIIRELTGRRYPTWTNERPYVDFEALAKDFDAVLTIPDANDDDIWKHLSAHESHQVLVLNPDAIESSKEIDPYFLFADNDNFARYDSDADDSTKLLLADGTCVYATAEPASRIFYHGSDNETYIDANEPVNLRWFDIDFPDHVASPWGTDAPVTVDVDGSPGEMSVTITARELAANVAERERQQHANEPRRVPYVPDEVNPNEAQPSL